MSKINVYDCEGRVVARVEYNQNLDFYDGRNFTCGGVGRHEGLTKLKDGRYVLIHGTQWQGEKDSAEIVSAEEALQAILSSGNDDLLELPKFAELKEMQTALITQEEE